MTPATGQRGRLPIAAARKRYTTARSLLRNEFRARTGAVRMLPTFLIIGAQRSGTTSLHHYLTQHPQIGAPFRKEIHYFDVKPERPLDWYRTCFPLRRSVRHTVDSSPYYLFHPAVPERVHEVLPAVKLIVLLRNPVERTYSHYHHSCARGHEQLSFAQAIAQEDTRLEGEFERLLADPTARSSSFQRYSYVTRSIYTPQLERWYEYFSPEQLLILRSEDLFADPAGVVRGVHKWLGIEPQPLASATPMNSRQYTDLDPELAERLAARFAGDREALERLTGLTFDWDH